MAGPPLSPPSGGCACYAPRRFLNATFGFFGFFFGAMLVYSIAHLMMGMFLLIMIFS